MGKEVRLQTYTPDALHNVEKNQTWWVFLRGRVFNDTTY